MDAIYASKVCEKLLTQAREIMKKDLYVAQEVRTLHVRRKYFFFFFIQVKPEVLEESVDTSDLPIPPDFPLPDAAFAFPECQVSSSALELLKLVRIILRSEM